MFRPNFRVSFDGNNDLGLVKTNVKQNYSIVSVRS